MLAGLLVQLQTLVNKSAYDRVAKIMPTILSNLGNVSAIVIDSSVDFLSEHANKILVFEYNGTITYDVPSDDSIGVDLPIGTIVTIITTDYAVRVRGNSPDDNDPDVYGAGFNSTNIWSIPPNSMGTLVKVGTNKWMVSAAGLEEFA